MSAESKEIIELEQQLLNAIKLSDIAVLDKLLHNDLLFITPDGQTVTKQMDLDSHRSGTMVVEALTSTVENINIIETIAIVVVVYNTKGKMLGNPIEGRFRYIRVWNFLNGGWKVIGGSCTKIE